TAAAKTATVAPNNAYSFLTYTAPYQSINGISLNMGTVWDEQEYKVPLGFNFKLYNKQNDTIRFFGGSIVSFDDINANNPVAAASPMYEDLCDRAWDTFSSSEGDPGGLSDLSYTVVGNPGQRVCIIQTRNAGFYGEIDALTASTSSLSFQVWLYETSNVV